MNVSVIVPVGNKAPFINNCVTNLLNQTMKSLEIIFVDAGSTDMSPYMIDRWAAQYPDRIKAVHCDPQRGIGGAINEGIRTAQGKYIGFARCEDEFDRMMYDKLFAAARGDVDMVECGLFDEAAGTRCGGIKRLDTGILDDEKKSEIVVSMSGAENKLYRKNAFWNEEGFVYMREGSAFVSDDFNLEILLKSKSCGTVREVLYNRRISMISDADVYMPQKQFEDAAALCAALSNVWETCGVAEGLNVNELESVRNFEDLREAVEAVIIKAYLNAIMICIKHRQNRGFMLNMNIETLKMMRNEYASSWRRNGYIDRILSEEDKRTLDWFDTIS